MDSSFYIQTAVTYWVNAIFKSYVSNLDTTLLGLLSYHDYLYQRNLFATTLKNFKSNNLKIIKESILEIQFNY